MVVGEQVVREGSRDVSDRPYKDFSMQSQRMSRPDDLRVELTSSSMALVICRHTTHAKLVERGNAFMALVGAPCATFGTERDWGRREEIEDRDRRGV